MASLSHRIQGSHTRVLSHVYLMHTAPTPVPDPCPAFATLHSICRSYFIPSMHVIHVGYKTVVILNYKHELLSIQPQIIMLKVVYKFGVYSKCSKKFNQGSSNFLCGMRFISCSWLQTTTNSYAHSCILGNQCSFNSKLCKQHSFYVKQL